MGTKHPRVDAYIEQSAEFAKPILTHLRALVHRACPDVEEAWKWSFPNFLYHGMMCNMAGFKAHCSFGFWKGDLIFGDDKTAAAAAKESMGHFGRILSRDDLPPDKVIIRYIKEAMRLNEAGVKKAPKPRAREPKELVVPESILTALKTNGKAGETFAAFSYSHKKEYVEWITEAKTEATRNKRLVTMLEWLAEGKSRNWKYQNC